MDYAPNPGDIGALVVSGAGGTAGTSVPFVVSSGGVASGCTLGVGTYVFVLGGQSSATPAQTTLVSAQLYWAAAVAATITIETVNFPIYLGGRAGSLSAPTAGLDVSDYDNTTGLWLQQNPSSAYVPVAGSGNTAVGMTVTAGGTAAGGCEFGVGNFGGRRLRVKIVTTVGGLVRCCIHGKDGGGAL